jgi:hypothetical protein
MAYRPAALEPLTESLFATCGYAGCNMLATHQLVAGGAPQFKCCVPCGAVAIEADRRKPGKGWT